MSARRLLLLGPPGAGKGTQAKFICTRFRIPQISTGDMLRAAIKAGTALGRKARKVMAAGRLVSDALIVDLVLARLSRRDCKRGYLFDGFPRTIPQAEATKTLLAKLNMKLDMAVNLNVPRDVILDRLTTRRTCENPKCQAIYNVKSMPPKVAGKCDKCGSNVIQRADETEEAISKRLDTYNEKTAPLIGFYQKEGMLMDVNATSSDAVVAAIQKKLGK